MAGYPKPGTLANANGLTFEGPAALPGGVALGWDGPIIRDMLAAVSLNAGDAVILAPSVGLNYVTKTSLADSSLAIGIITGGRVGVSVASAASQPVWVVTGGFAWANPAASTIVAGDLLSTGSLPAGAGGQVAKSTGRTVVVTFPATVSLATSFPSYSTVDVGVTVAGMNGELPFAFQPTANMVSGIAITNVWNTAGSSNVSVRVVNPTSLPIASQASLPGTMFTTRSGQPVAEAVFAIALASVSASGVPLAVYVMRT